MNIEKGGVTKPHKSPIYARYSHSYLSMWYYTKMRSFLRSKIHRATVTEADIAYVGSITIDQNLLEKADLLEGERVLVTSVTSGSRLETYVIAGEAGSGVICMNGSAAHLIKKGETVIIMGFELSDNPVAAKVILVDDANRFVRYL